MDRRWFFKRMRNAVLFGAAFFWIYTPQVSVAEEGAEMRITLLGTGTPPVSATQFGAATLIEAGGHALLFDCGRGCGIRLMQARPKLYTKINTLFFTHMHSDHMVGVPDIYMNGWLLGRASTFNAFGPVGTRHFMEGLRKAFEPDVYTRNQLEKLPSNTDGLELKIQENPVDGGVVFEEGGVKVTAFLVDHAAAKPAYGYRVDYNGRSVMLTGDTKATKTLEDYGRGVDVIVHEVVPTALIEKLKTIYQPAQVQNIVDHHMLAEDVGRLLAETKPRLGVFSHYLSTPKSNAQLLAETRSYWQGPIEAGADLMQIIVGANEIQVCPDTKDCRIVSRVD